jgi:hypothetical protein
MICTQSESSDVEQHSTEVGREVVGNGAGVGRGGRVTEVQNDDGAGARQRNTRDDTATASQCG